MTRRNRPGDWTPEQLDVVRIGWPAGWPMEEILRLLPGRTPRSIQYKAHQLGVRRPGWFIKASRRRAGTVAAMVKHGRRNIWTVDATNRLLTVARRDGLQAAAVACQVTVEQAKGRLYRIGYRFTEEKPPEPDEPEFIKPTLPDAERVSRLVARFEATKRGRLSLAIPT